MKALTLWRPWSDAIVRGPKRVENRTWAPLAGVVGRFIAIHAGSRFDDSGGIDLMAMGSGWTPPLEPDESPMGIVGAARIVGSLNTRMRDPMLRLQYADRADRDRLAALDRDPWWVGPVGWLLDDVIAIEPVPCRGAQGLWTVPPDVEALVRARVVEAAE